jgi:MerR family transcriptional regulator, thiopeptide resistance regulator
MDVSVHSGEAHTMQRPHNRHWQAPLNKRGYVMHLKIGEVSKHTGLTVRTLHHYDSLGLLVPSTRSNVGYRLYDLADMRRLLHIQVLCSFGFSLEEIGTFLMNESDDLRDTIKHQIMELDRQIAVATELRARFKILASNHANNTKSGLDYWLVTLKLMNKYNNKRLPCEKFANS